MTDQTPQAQPAELTVPKRPEKPDEYTIWLERKINSVKTELEAKPGAESRGTVWSNFYGVHNDPEGNPHVVQFNITGRSDVSPVEALRLMLDLEQFAKRQGLFPWPPGNVQVTARGDVRRETELPAGEPPAPATSTVIRRKVPQTTPTAEKAVPAETGSGEEQIWIKATKLELAKTTGGVKYIKVHTDTPRFAKWGVAAYLDSSGVPTDIVEMIEAGQWSLDSEIISGADITNNFPELAMALVEIKDKKTKVIQFKTA